jgi:leader peptidase (prepilin peptidase)/N-methyltransferase
MLGLIFGSFFNVVGIRLPEGKSIAYPPSTCPKCGRKLRFYELIPVISYIIQLGKCRGCKQHISITYPIFELLTGLLFAACYYVFGFSSELIIALTFVSGLVIIIISDIHYLSIPDEIILIFSISIIIEKVLIEGIHAAAIALGGGMLSFILMYLIKLCGDYFFKEESLGGGDIKLMFLIGCVLGIWVSMFSIMLAAFLALPISIIILIYKKSNIISFGPFLSMAGMLFYLLHINLNDIINFLIKY